MIAGQRLGPVLRPAIAWCVECKVYRFAGILAALVVIGPDLIRRHIKDQAHVPPVITHAQFQRAQIM